MAKFKEIESDKDLIEMSRKGIDKQYVLEILKDSHLTLKEFATFLNVSTRMIQKKQAHDKFSPLISEHALYIAKLYRKGKEVFGDVEKFSAWMETENPSMGFSKPKSYLDTYSRIQLLLNKLIGIAHGFPT